MTLGERHTVLPREIFAPIHHRPPKHLETDQSDDPQANPKKVLGSPNSFAWTTSGLSKQDTLQKSMSHLENFLAVDQGGRGICALDNVRRLQPCVIKEIHIRKSLRSLRPVEHKNIVSLREYCEIDNKRYLVYEYEHLAMSLGVVASTVPFCEADIATVCREVLEGLQYIHSELKTSHGSINVDNLLLTWAGEVKIANIGESMLQETALEYQRRDIVAVGLIVLNLYDRRSSLSRKSPESFRAESNLSSCAQDFIECTGECTSLSFFSS
ncbi:uncharacterized protein ATNIH1004_009168 [Aspergillus tanneri]|uniref:Protein kinase domain-containing protein n=1 Tax=Aspergillus tanneri TaxID=1220188 RepID=A0A5M9MQW6_9EURO|nr:uncharacterized protein ATNIH1004_009168 [Aspergillus tanneri]KAA8644957.1 hypothetical protein ATNIH1004_009168 [Aspergillus tanneri]